MFHKSWCASGDLSGTDGRGRGQDPGLAARATERKAEPEVFTPPPLSLPLLPSSPRGEVRATANQASWAEASCSLRSKAKTEKGRTARGLGAGRFARWSPGGRFCEVIHWQGT